MFRYAAGFTQWAEGQTLKWAFEGWCRSSEGLPKTIKIPTHMIQHYRNVFGVQLPSKLSLPNVFITLRKLPCDNACESYSDNN
jgi:hypothetical protein